MPHCIDTVGHTMAFGTQLWRTGLGKALVASYDMTGIKCCGPILSPALDNEKRSAIQDYKYRITNGEF